MTSSAYAAVGALEEEHLSVQGNASLKEDYEGGKMQSGIGANKAEFSEESKLKAGEWASVAMVYREEETGKVSFYINGNEVVSNCDMGFRFSTMDHVEAFRTGQIGFRFSIWKNLVC